MAQSPSEDAAIHAGRTVVTLAINGLSLAAGVYVQGTDPGVDRNGACLNAAGVQAAGGWYV